MRENSFIISFLAGLFSCGLWALPISLATAQSPSVQVFGADDNSGRISIDWTTEEEGENGPDRVYLHGPFDLPAGEGEFECENIAGLTTFSRPLDGFLCDLDAENCAYPDEDGSITSIEDLEEIGFILPHCRLDLCGPADASNPDLPACSTNPDDGGQPIYVTPVRSGTYFLVFGWEDAGPKVDTDDYTLDPADCGNITAEILPTPEVQFTVTPSFANRVCLTGCSADPICRDFSSNGLSRTFTCPLDKLTRDVSFTCSGAGGNDTDGFRISLGPIGDENIHIDCIGGGCEDTNSAAEITLNYYVTRTATVSYLLEEAGNGGMGGGGMSDMMSDAARGMRYRAAGMMRTEEASNADMTQDPNFLSGSNLQVPTKGTVRTKVTAAWKGLTRKGIVKTAATAVKRAATAVSSAVRSVRGVNSHSVASAVKGSGGEREIKRTRNRSSAMAKNDRAFGWRKAWPRKGFLYGKNGILATKEVRWTVLLTLSSVRPDGVNVSLLDWTWPNSPATAVGSYETVKDFNNNTFRVHCFDFQGIACGTKELDLSYGEGEIELEVFAHNFAQEWEWGDECQGGLSGFLGDTMWDGCEQTCEGDWNYNGVHEISAAYRGVRIRSIDSATCLFWSRDGNGYTYSSSSPVLSNAFREALEGLEGSYTEETVGFEVTTDWQHVECHGKATDFEGRSLEIPSIVSDWEDYIETLGCPEGENQGGMGGWVCAAAGAAAGSAARSAAGSAAGPAAAAAAAAYEVCD